MDGACLLVGLDRVLVAPAPRVDPVLEGAVVFLEGEVLFDPGREERFGVIVSRSRDDGRRVPEPDLGVAGPGGETVDFPGLACEFDLVVTESQADELPERLELGPGRKEIRGAAVVEAGRDPVLGPGAFAADEGDLDRRPSLIFEPELALAEEVEFQAVFPGGERRFDADADLGGLPGRDNSGKLSPRVIEPQDGPVRGQQMEGDEASGSVLTYSIPTGPGS